ncbi:MAG: 16S rRNA (cytosine(1402)-N(4))-methyltransferase RsmH [Flavobacteriaceae bacterium]|nr:16S rRNA (cytosine(1402)-N(4))-methyltransferase RsmH [Flavobacteriaceae bacterium]
MNDERSYHDPVLLYDAVEGLNIKRDGVYVDVTYGGGGHSAEILKRLGDQGKLFAFDQDEDAIANKAVDTRLVFIQENFRFMKNHLRFHGVKKVDGILADLGVSSHQFDRPERGFSTRFDSLLDMRMSQTATLTAKQVINEYDEDALKKMFFEYGDLSNAKALATTIVNDRKVKTIESSLDLKTALKRFLPQHHAHKILAKIFQAVRIEVNQEMEALKEMLTQTEQLLNPGGRLVVISYHSLEDRLVKRFMKNGLFEGEPQRDVFGNYEVPFKKINGLIVPSKDEINKNNRARSAKLRMAERL